MNKITKVKSDFEILELDTKEGLTITKKDQNEKVEIYDPIIIQEIIDKNFEKKYKKILYKIMLFNEQENNSSDDAEAIVLEIDNFRKYLINKYYYILGGHKLNQYINMLLMLESQINIEHTKSR